MADFGLVKSFDIDDGQLDGESPQTCFALGYELARIDVWLKEGTPIVEQLVHAANKERIKKACGDAGVDFTLTWMQGDSSEQWMTLTVKEPEDPQDLLVNRHKPTELRILKKLSQRWVQCRDTKYAVRWWDAYHLADSLSHVLSVATDDELEIIGLLLDAQEPPPSL